MGLSIIKRGLLPLSLFVSFALAEAKVFSLKKEEWMDLLNYWSNYYAS